MHEANMENTTNIKEKLTFYVTMIVATTLCLCMLAMVGAFLLGLWAKEVDNNSIFGLIGPAFQTLCGGLIGFLSGVKLMQTDEKPREAENVGTRCTAPSGRETDRQTDT
jgi:hypothetical protein